jgi:hypothetical protein
LAELFAGGVVLEANEGLVGGDAFSVGHEHGGDAAGDFGEEDDLILGAHGAAQAFNEGEGADAGLSGLDRRGGDGSAAVI